jgi:hypothetical protein
MTIKFLCGCVSISHHSWCYIYVEVKNGYHDINLFQDSTIPHELGMQLKWVGVRTCV